ncbi:hypothetical protein [Pseudenhygromyxa sp. WMMC2535]|nr:hypothetical protein [Pseudenhygromyxa sp. WMMC2535]
MVEDFDHDDDLAAMIRGLPETEQRLAYAMLGNLYIYATASR